MGRVANLSRARQRGSRLGAANLDRAPHPQDIFDGEHDHREDVEDLELQGVALIEALRPSRRRKVYGIQEDEEDDDEDVDHAPPQGLRIAAHFEDVMDLAPPPHQTDVAVMRLGAPLVF